MPLILELINPNTIDIEASDHGKLTFSSDGKTVLVKESISIGRSGDLRIKKRCSDVSRIHCKLISGFNSWILHDESRWGTKISGVKEPLHETEVPLRAGMLFTISPEFHVLFEVKDV